MTEAAITEPGAGPSGPGTVVLELGAGVGALVLYTPAELDGREIEISPDEPGARRTHSQVRPRHMATGTRYAAVYPDLAAGPYTVWADQQRPAGRVDIAGGRITNWSWPDASISPAAGSRTGAGRTRNT